MAYQRGMASFKKKYQVNEGITSSGPNISQ